MQGQQSGTWNHSQQSIYQQTAQSTNPYSSQSVLPQGIQNATIQNFPRASLLQANANAAYQRPTHVKILVITIITAIFIGRLLLQHETGRHFIFNVTDHPFIADAAE